MQKFSKKVVFMGKKTRWAGNKRPKISKNRFSDIILETKFRYPINSNKPYMKNRNISHTHEEAKIYQNYYRPSFNVFRLLKSVLSVFISGSSPAAHGYNYNKKTPH